MDKNEQTVSRFLPLVLLATAMFTTMGGPALSPALPSIKAAYSQVPDIEFWVKLLVGVSGLFAAVGAPLFGWMSDRYGRKRTLVTALTFWAVFGSSGMIPQPFWTLLAGRALLGLGLGGLMASNTAIIADRFSADRQRHMMGLQSSFSSVGTVAALIVSGALADLHWHLSFCLFLAGFAILPFAFGLSETSPMDGTPDRRRASFPLSFGLILLCFFGFMSMFVFNVVPTQLPFFLKQTLHITAASRMGLILAMLPVSSAISGRFYARISRRFSLWNMFLFSGVAMLAGFGLLGMAKGDAVVVAGLMLIGLGFGTAFPHVNVVMAQVVPSAARGRAMGVMSSCKYLGLFASPVLLQPVLAGSSYRFTFYFAGCLLLLVALVIRVVGSRLVPGAAEPKGINA